MQRLMIILSCLLVTSIVDAEIVMDSTPTETGSPAFGINNANSNFIGTVDSSAGSGITIRTNANGSNNPVTTTFSLADSSKRPPVNSVSGRDLQDAPNLPDDPGHDFQGAMWEYTVSAPSGEFLATVDFDASIWYAGNNLDATDTLTYDFFLDGNPVGSTIEFNAGAEGLADPMSDGIQEIDSTLNLFPSFASMPSTARVKVTVDGFAGGSEAFWANGTLAAESRTVPEPSAFAFLGLVGLGWAGYQNRGRVFAWLKQRKA